MKKKNMIITAVMFVVVIVFLVSINGMFFKDNKKDKEIFKVVFVDAKVSDNASVKISDDGKKLTFITPGFKNIGESTTLSFKVENKGNVDAKINGIICTAKGVYKDSNNKTDEEIKNAEKNAIDYSNYVTAGLSNKLVNKELKVGKVSKKETLTINVTRELKHNKDKVMIYECVIDAKEL